MSRANTRESAFKTIYGKLFCEEDEAIVELENIDEEFYNKLVNGFLEHKKELDETISSNLKGITIERVFKIDLALIYLALVELNYIKENPVQVVINEVVELAKKYSTEKSPKFINGFLASVVK